MIILLLLPGILLSSSPCAAHDYSDALSKSILFFEGQRSGKLPETQRMDWRNDSALSDGETVHVDLSGGYYDAGDNVKFGFPMSFTISMLAWSALEFGNLMNASQRHDCLIAIRWGTDYLLKTVSDPHKIYAQVGDPVMDHDCWQRPEDIGYDRSVYHIDFPSSASDLAAETAAALAASSIVFKLSDPSYSEALLSSAVQVFQLADQHRGSYTQPGSFLRNVSCPYYCSSGVYQDELLWASAWLWKASGNEKNLLYIVDNGEEFGANQNKFEFGWEDKHAGLNVLLSQIFLQLDEESLRSYKTSADELMCSIMQKSNVIARRTNGGLIYKTLGSNLQVVTSLTFLLLTYANYIEHSFSSVSCGDHQFGPESLRSEAKKQVDYILGDNPMGLSYMVGYGKEFPQKIHHRASSLPSTKVHPDYISCQDGSSYFVSLQPNPNVLIGAVVGGPKSNDQYDDDRYAFQQSEPATYINAPFVGVLAYFASLPSS